MSTRELKHLISDAPRVMVVDGSKLVRKLISDVLQRELPDVEVVGCAGIEEARTALATGPVHLVTTSLALPDGDGLALARSVREAAGQAYVPVIVVSGDAQRHLEQALSDANEPQMVRDAHLKLAQMHDALQQTEQAAAHYRQCALATIL